MGFGLLPQESEDYQFLWGHYTKKFKITLFFCGEFLPKIGGKFKITYVFCGGDET